MTGAGGKRLYGALRSRVRSHLSAPLFKADPEVRRAGAVAMAFSGRKRPGSFWRLSRAEADLRCSSAEPPSSTLSGPTAKEASGAA